jgi:hypothetical protein
VLFHQLTIIQMLCCRQESSCLIRRSSTARHVGISYHELEVLMKSHHDQHTCFGSASCID